MNKKKYLLIIWSLLIASCHATPPQLTVVIVIDQFSHWQMERLKPYFRHGFKTLLDNGIVYERAYHPHSFPATATGHATIGTGTTASNHGFVLNCWYEHGTKIVCTNDDDHEARTFSRNGLTNHGVSAKRLMADTFADQFTIQGNNANPAYSISHKARAAVGMAGKAGKAIWYDTHEKIFTSSGAYFKELPEWLKKFNKTNDLRKQKKINWKLMYDKNHPAYQDHDRQEGYRYTALKAALAGTTRTIKTNQGPTKDRHDNDELFLRTPAANELALQLASECIDHCMKPDKPFLLFVSLSPLDLLSHPMGPESIEVTDMILQLDLQIENFIKNLYKKCDPKKVLIALTSDHGTTPIPEARARRGMTLARRIPLKKIIKKMNSIADEKYGISEDIVAFVKGNAFYLNHATMESLKPQEKNELIESLRTLLLNQPGIKNVYTPNMLMGKDFPPTTLEYLFKNQLYPGRHGDLLCLPDPYCMISKNSGRINHSSAWAYDRHVPLILYQKGVLRAKRISSTVWIPQLAATLASLLEIQPPTTCIAPLLPLIKYSKLHN